MKNTYNEMKDSGFNWLGRIPIHWQLTDIGSLYTQRNERVSDKDYEPLSVTKKGILPQLSTVAKTDDGDNRKLVKSGDFVINSRSDRRGSCGISPCDGSVSLINTVLSPRSKMYPDYFNWLFHTEAFADEFYKWGHGIVDDLWTTRWSEMKQIVIPIPEFMTQTAIAAYLDEKCGMIDEIIAEAKASIEEYKAWKSSVIFEAVTKGLNPHAEMKDSGVDIIGLMPKHWNLCRQRFLCKTTTGDHDTQDAEPEGTFPFYVRSPIIERSNTYTFDGEGVLMAGDGAGAGRVFHYATGKYAIHQRVYCFYDFKGILPRFYHYFMENLFCAEMDKGSAKSTVPSVRLPMLKDFNICLPSLTEQANIITALDEKCAAIDGIIAEKEALIADMEAYKKSLIFETVTGKRKVC